MACTPQAVPEPSTGKIPTSLRTHVVHGEIPHTDSGSTSHRILRSTSLPASTALCRFFKILLFYVCECFAAFIYTTWVQCQERPKEGVRALVTGVTVTERYHVDSRD